MKSILSVFLAFVLLLSQAACTSGQVNNVITTVGAQLPLITTEITTIASLTGAGNVAPFLTAISKAAAVDAPVLITAYSAYKTNESSGTYAALSAAANTFASDVNAQFLQANGVANTESEKLALASIGSFVLTLNLVAAVIAAANPSAVKNVAPMVVPTSEVAKYFTTSQINEVAKAHNVTSEQVKTFLNEGN